VQQVAAGDEAGGAVVGGEVVQRPGGVRALGSGRPGLGQEVLVGVQVHLAAPWAGDVGRQVAQQDALTDHGPDEPQRDRVLGQVDEPPGAARQVPDPLVGLVARGVRDEVLAQAAAQLLVGHVVERAADRHQRRGVQHAGDGADTVLSEVTLGALDVVGRRRQSVQGRGHASSGKAVRSGA